jgi:hypothetical protein
LQVTGFKGSCNPQLVTCNFSQVKPSIRNKLSRIFLNPFVVAIPFALVTIYLLPLKPFGHSITQVSRYLADKAPLKTSQTYIDLDGDFVSEAISHFSNTINKCAIKISTKNNILLGQWNFNGSIAPGGLTMLAFDYDNDGIKDVFTIYSRSDSVFIGGINPFAESGYLFNDVFLDKINCCDGEKDFSTGMQAADMDNDGYLDVVISLSAGHGEQPRRMITWYPKNDSIIKSENIGVYIGEFSIEDIDLDGTNEIIPTSCSFENIDEDSPIPLNDWKKWFLVYDHHLQPEFEPICLGRGNGSTASYLLHRENGPRLLILDFNNKMHEKYRFYLYDWNKGDTVRWFPAIDFAGDITIRKTEIHGKSYLHFIDHSGKIFLLNATTLDFEKVTSTADGIENLRSMDINNDSLPELIFENNQGHLCIYSGSFDDQSQIELLDGLKNPVFSLRKVDSSRVHLVMQNGNEVFEYLYAPQSNFKYLVYLIYLLVYGGYVLTVGFVMYGQERYLKRRYEREKLIAELKLKSIRNQLDPHFTFNAVNAIASAIFKEDKQNAYSYFSKFSKLVRSTMLYSDRMTRLLDDELDFTLKYLEIEKFRFREKFEFEIKVDDDVDLNMEIPRMIIQAYAESSINNGLMHRITDGLLVIKVNNGDGHLNIELIDNGVGIEKSKELNREKAFKSAKIMEEFIAVFNEFNKVKISCEMKDLFEEGKVLGTHVVIKIPLDIKYTFSGNVNR